MQKNRVFQFPVSALLCDETPLLSPVEKPPILARQIGRAEDSGAVPRKIGFFGSLLKLRARSRLSDPGSRFRLSK